MKEITNCRICSNSNLVEIHNFSNQSLTGVFPASESEKITTGDITILKCAGSEGCCGLVQLRQSYNLDEMYGNNYGYRSGLNKSMSKHLKQIADKAKQIISFKPDDVVIDIGSNDGTLLKCFDKNLILVGIDPTIRKFEKYYPDYMVKISDFFPYEPLDVIIAKKKAKIITSIAMFYDIENPLFFMQSIYDILDDNGIWIFEQHYLSDIIKTIGYDVFCHEHLSYYAFKQIYYMTEKVGLKIIDIEHNDLNGGSLLVVVAKKGAKYKENKPLIDKYLKQEKQDGIDDIETYKYLSHKINLHKNRLKWLIFDLNKQGKKVFGYCASTKGNVILQNCGFTKDDIPYFAEVNKDKFGKLTPQTHIPIIDEQEAKKMKPDYFLVMAWHFKNFILEKEKDWIKQGGKFIFPLPEIEVV